MSNDLYQQRLMSPTEAAGLIPSGVPVHHRAPSFGFYPLAEHPAVQSAHALINQGCGREVELTSYHFATDGRYFVKYNLPMIGYAPGEEFVAHTVRENVAIASMRVSLQGYVALLVEF